MFSGSKALRLFSLSLMLLNIITRCIFRKKQIAYFHSKSSTSQSGKDIYIKKKKKRVKEAHGFFDSSAMFLSLKTAVCDWSLYWITNKGNNLGTKSRVCYNGYLASHHKTVLLAWLNTYVNNKWLNFLHPSIKTRSHQLTPSREGNGMENETA